MYNKNPLIISNIIITSAFIFSLSFPFESGYTYADKSTGYIK